MKLMTFFTMIFFIFNHPMYMLMSIIFITLMMSILIYKSMKMMWISLILILLILGGMLILFLYIISLIPNKKLSLNKKIMMLMIFLLMSFPPFKMLETSFLLMNYNFFTSSMNMMLFMMIYLICTLIVVMNIMTSSNAPLSTL
uniref:NADH dehydrogenase subunit 6 n=1 Tax=Ixodes ricinus TaxID=34613 RepID=A0A088BDG5_IXORI|nr:NADH dehydrogenase subunit 6 [Ixodes ricinus]AGW06773.1 NADH dehydrogenase subunit 6 [Ixodes ricinus]AGW06786.1 NADH dehydrogenase subunit 6 [Ixodes ricinus]AGW06890.1 NADH dehydrogenase subunit 6 [Ixodes ricinus]AGW06955.1 NADH dehydrogenase subunit 6 [Ixodes ricinus]